MGSTIRLRHLHPLRGVQSEEMRLSLHDERSRSPHVQDVGGVPVGNRVDKHLVKERERATKEHNVSQLAKVEPRM